MQGTTACAIALRLIAGVRYEELTPMLINEIQRQQVQLGDMRRELAELQEFRRSMQPGAAR